MFFEKQTGIDLYTIFGVRYGDDVKDSTGGDYQVIYQKTQDIVHKRIPEAILANPADFDRLYDAFLEEMNQVGAEKMEKEYTELGKAIVALFTGKKAH